MYDSWLVIFIFHEWNAWGSYIIGQGGGGLHLHIASAQPIPQACFING